MQQEQPNDNPPARQPLTVADLEGSVDHGGLHQFVTEAYKSATIEGQEIIQTPDGDLLEHVLMDEDYFVNNWLGQFALANVAGHCYFDHASWGAMTQQFTKGVIVVSAAREYLFAIPKFSQAILPDEAKHVMDELARRAGVAQLVPDENEKTKIINNFAVQAKYVGDVAQSQGHVTITDMIPAEFYATHDVSPLAMKQTIFIRDKYNPSEADLERVDVILKKWNMEKVVSPADRKFIQTVTQDNFIFDEGDDMVAPVVGQEKTDEVPFDPFAD